MRWRISAPNTHPLLVIEYFGKLGFKVTRASKLISRKTGSGMILHLVKVLPCKDFDKICDIRELCNVSVSIQHFCNNNNSKQCFCCQC